MNIVYTCQENYSQIAGISIFSLLKNNPKSDIHIFFLDSNLSLKSKNMYFEMCKKHGNAVIEFLNVNDLLQVYTERLTSYQNNYATYCKLFLESLLPTDVKECLYIDADTIIIKNILQIFEEQRNNGKTLAMHPDTILPSYKKKMNFSVDEPYFNAGVIYINLDLWRERNYTQRIIEVMQCGKAFPFADQDIINTVFRGDISKLSFGDNVFSQLFLYKDTFDCKRIYCLNDSNFYTNNEFDLDNIRIVHFTTHPCILRPWFYGSQHPLALMYVELVKESPFSGSFEFKKAVQPGWREMIQRLLGKWGTSRYRFFAMSFGGMERKYLDVKEYINKEGGCK